MTYSILAYHELSLANQTACGLDARLNPTDLILIAYAAVGGASASILVAILRCALIFVGDRFCNKTKGAGLARSPTDPGHTAGSYAWLDQDDLPISHPNDDRYDHLIALAKRIAKRIAKRDARSTRSPTFLIYGPFGSGKSSVYELSKYYYRRPELIGLSRASARYRVEWCHISAWPHEDSNSLLSHILEVVTTSMRRHVDSRELSGIGYRYINSISSNGGLLGRIADLAALEQSSPEGKISRIEQILCACDFRVIVWIDDLERFAEKTSKDRPIEALLCLFRAAPHLSFVLCKGTN